MTSAFGCWKLLGSYPVTRCIKQDRKWRLNAGLWVATIRLSPPLNGLSMTKKNVYIYIIIMYVYYIIYYIYYIYIIYNIFIYIYITYIYTYINVGKAIIKTTSPSHLHCFGWDWNHQSIRLVPLRQHPCSDSHSFPHRSCSPRPPPSAHWKRVISWGFHGISWGFNGI